MFAASLSSLQQLTPAAVPGTLFVKYSLDGKEASLVNVCFDSTNHLLWITPITPSPGVSLDLSLLKVATCMCTPSYQSFSSPFQFVESGNLPKESSKVKKLLNPQKVYTLTLC